ncbi:MAG: TetR/AcrR family transcriptional regulator [Bacteroidia bacterium]
MKKLSTNEKLIQSARKLFLAFGIKKVSVEEICLEAGCSKMSFYRLFKNKADIAKVVLTEIALEGRESYNAIMNQEISFADKMKQVVAQKHENAKAVSLEFLKDLYSNYPDIMSELDSFRSESIKLFIDDLKKARKEGFIRKDIKIDFIIYMFNRIQLMLQDEELLSQFKSVQEASDNITKLLFYGILKEE